MSKNLPSPLLLEQSHFLSTQVEAAKDFEQTEEITVNIQRSCSVHHEDSKLWRVELEVGFGKNGKVIHQPYFGKVRVELYLRIHPSFPNERIPDLIKVNGVSLAYGMIRESVANLTSRGPHGVFLLPSVSFIEQKKSASLSKKISANPSKK
jgi:preprotein translocase subunit SecB